MGAARRRTPFPVPGPVTRAVDRLVETISPGAAIKRQAARARLSAFHDGARNFRGTANRDNPRGSADQALRCELGPLLPAHRATG